MKKDKNEELAQEAFKQFCNNMMDEVFLESILIQWASDLRKYHREKLITLHEFVEKSTCIVISTNLSLKVIYSKKNTPLLAVSRETENPEFFIFKEDICTDAFRVPAERIEETMSEEVIESFYRFFKTALSSGDLFNEKPESDNTFPQDKYSIN